MRFLRDYYWKNESNGRLQSAPNPSSKWKSPDNIMPILCSRSSIKDVRLPKWHRKSPEIDPSSPKVSCMGQVKRNNRVIGFPSTAAAAASNSRGGNNIKYEKLKRMFSGKSILNCSTNAAGERNVEIARVMNNIRCAGEKMRNCAAATAAAAVNVGEMDPPLPVVKKEEGGENVSLWKRRSGGIALKNLDLHQQQQHAVTPNSLFIQPRTF